MKLIDDDFHFEDFDAWEGAIDTKEKIISAGKQQEFEMLIEELFPDGIADMQLNDILWFEEDWLFSELGIREGDDENEDDEE